MKTNIEKPNLSFQFFDPQIFPIKLLLEMLLRFVLLVYNHNYVIASARGIFRTCQTSKMERFAEIVHGYNYFRKMLHLRCLTGFLIGSWKLIHRKLTMLENNVKGSPMYTQQMYREMRQVRYLKNRYSEKYRRLRSCF